MEVVIDFARAQHHPSDFIVGDKLDLLVREHLRFVPQQTMERRVRPHVGEPRDTARRWRSRDFGVIRMSGLRMSRLSCRRRMWKELAGGVEFATPIFSSAALL